MKNILNGLYNGKIIPWERRASYSENQLKAIDKIEREEQYFIEKMSLDDCERFQALSRLHMDIFSEEQEDIFSYGFTLGLLMMMDIAEQAKLITGE